ncbi:Acyl-protein synthetase, LuxE [Pseudarcicella hirudinis]|uniref:Acyl-protein synthetase, LuxE n=2 Tax=Pseudarcicella hirudinis TaxID=1079859 RepID=A0A1I5U9P5_9BACT|nr:acyl transferase [Pseudarcicella hirudinis]SFP92003.1 Acyl-protein synthetase, LuxE [Pseudarcicella hirudinis]
MNQAQLLKQRVLGLNASDFDQLALDIFHFQVQNNEVYRKYLHHLSIDPLQVKEVSEIPFLPIEFFKTQTILSGEVTPKVIFESSGTTGQNTSRHLVADPDFYLKVSEQIFEKFYGKLSDFHVLALLPSYLERNNSSLVYMVQHFIERSNSAFSGFFLNDFESLIDRLKKASEQGGNSGILLIGVTFALLDLAESEFDLSFLENNKHLIVMETGGMKGRRKELLREEVHEILTKAFSVSHIHSEYGMTELLSQGYSFGEGIFQLSDSMRIILRDVNDPLTRLEKTGKTGGINVIDLANIDSCSFIETRDLGVFKPDGRQFSILGRFDNSDIRGCNLMVN